MANGQIGVDKVIKIKYNIDDEGKITGIKITGHSLAGTEEHKIVCNSVSIASQMVAFSLNDLLKIDCVESFESGHLEIDLKDKRTKETDLLMETLEHFLKEIKDNYSDHIEIE